jgi:hypothetical protein
MSELIDKVTRAIAGTGYPLELEIGKLARCRGWVVFHSQEYFEPIDQKTREFDLLIYKVINGRRIEIRLSCKSSRKSQFVFFTRPEYAHRIGDLKITPIPKDVETLHRLPTILENLWFYAHPRSSVNYTVVSGEHPDREGRALLRDAIMSSVNSVHDRLLPHKLLLDPRGTVYFFSVVLRGNIFEAYLSDAGQEIEVTECDYAQWHTRLRLPHSYWKCKVINAEGKKVPFGSPMYYFGDWMRVEIVSERIFGQYLDQIESTFVSLSGAQLDHFGKPWTEENFPKVIGPRPTLDAID